jgi:hypothetical protein
MRTWEDAIKEDNLYDEWGALNLACDADAPLEVIQYLVDTTSRRGIPETDEALRIVIERKRELNVLRCVANEWSYYESIYVPFLEEIERKRALYRFENNCPDLTRIRIGWPLPSENVLRDVVKAIASSLTIERVDIVKGKYLTLPWWIGKETSIVELLKSALGENTSITDIRVKLSGNSYDNRIIDIVQYSRQLKSLSFKGRYISKEMAAALMKQLSIQRLYFTDCHVSEEATAFFVEALEGEHSFTKIELFEVSGGKSYTTWYKDSWEETITAEIKRLTWTNRFKVDKDTFLHEVLGPASVKDKLASLSRRRGVYLLSVDSLSDSARLCYGAMEAANIYDYDHKLTSDAPSMLYSLIREIPQFFKQFVVDDGAKQQMKKRRRV